MRGHCDFSKHVLAVTETEHFNTWDFRKPNTIIDAIKYTNIDGVLIVTGDYGNWIFCRPFRPSADGYVSDGYWMEKLAISSSQEGYEFDVEATRQELGRMIEVGYEEYGYSGDKLRKAIEYANGCLENVDENELDYKYFAYREFPNFMDYDEVIFIKTPKYWLKVVFDGFDEICKRLKEEQAKVA